SLPDVRQELATGARLTRLTIAHEPLRRAQDRHAKPVPHARNLADTHVAAQTRTRHALKLANHGLATGRIAQVDAQYGPAILDLHDAVVRNVGVLLEDAGDLYLHFRHRQVHAAMPGRYRVPDAREHVGDRIGHAHSVCNLFLSYPAAQDVEESEKLAGRLTRSVVKDRKSTR